MKASEYVAFLASPAGAIAVGDAAKVLRAAGPEDDDAALLERVKALGFPQWVAARIFLHTLQRYAPLTCRKCHRQFKPKSLRTVDRPYCHPCVKGPQTPEQTFKNRARQLAFQALSHGKIKRQPCTQCGWQFSQMHHPDYSRPLHVVWLCSRCHAKEHKAMRVSHGTV